VSHPCLRVSSLGSHVHRWHASTRPIIDDVDLDSCQSRIILLERTVEQSAEHDVGPSLIDRFDRLIIHPLQRRLFAHVHSILTPLNYLYRVNTGTEELRVHLLRQGTEVETVLEVT
jgi:hypothetical protein